MLSSLSLLYFAQGLPFGFFSHAVPVLLNRDHRAEIVGLSSLLALPWGLKFLWAPLVERVRPKGRWGRRKRVILPAQLATFALLVTMGSLGSGEAEIAALVLGFFLVSLLSATQDIATDALTIELLPVEDRGRGGAIQTGAYRLGMIAGGGGVLALADQLGYREAFWLMAAMVALASLPLLLLREPRSEEPASPQPEAKESLLLGFLRTPTFWPSIGLITVYKLGDALCAGMVTRWFVKAGVSTTHIASSRGLAGGLASVAGAILAAYAVGRLSRRAALVTMASAQAAAVAMYLGLALLYPVEAPMPLWGFYAASIVEHVAGGAATAVLFTFMMDRVRPHAPATDYTAQASLLVFITGIGLVGSGFIVGQVGLVGLFAVATCASALSPGLVGRLYRRVALDTPPPTRRVT